ncbi:MAG: DUF2911 domain-containing protein [Verrucomicrobiota bacterium]|nr:DUF2911 domain-containing protein [Verrucomicrobiota bacterium]
MKTGTIILLHALLLTASPLFAQEHKRVSPHETVNATVDGDALTIVYGRPYTKDPKSGEKRKIWGGLVPFGKVWRMGADEATLFTTKEAIEMGGTSIPAGTYSLYMLPEEGGAKLIVNKQTGQWGTKYDESQDLARIEMKKSTLDLPADQFAVAIADEKEGGSLKAMWEETQYTVDFTVKK